ncbi:uncharacterized protein LOC114935428 [Nylanderia fulva]|uniref:uncharacterized protein LOC114935428 n=1 Tax=Nylanderia fulva TaxID=613905 RepID=UPI0010FAE1CB|nr:uncharacterized protein LOC114935428 [Nylanderia fulva]
MEDCWQNIECISDRLYGQVASLRERFAKEKRIFEQEGKSGAAASTRPEWALYSVMSFLTPHIRKRKSVDNFQTKALVSKTTPSPDEEIIINEQAVDINSAPFIISTCSTLSSPGCSSSAANMPYLGPTSRKRSKVDETDELFRETLTNLNKSMAVASAPTPPLSSPPSINDPDVLISRNVESCLKNLTNMTKYFEKLVGPAFECASHRWLPHNGETAILPKIQQPPHATPLHLQEALQMHSSKHLQVLE